MENKEMKESGTSISSFLGKIQSCIKTEDLPKISTHVCRFLTQEDFLLESLPLVDYLLQISERS